MRPFDFVITFFSFIYSLALAHLLLAVAHMIRRRREIALDWAHVLWMTVALATLVVNWISFWDVHAYATLSLASIAIGFVFSINQYLVCALVSPRIGAEDGFDMRAFHDKEGTTYIGAILVLLLFSIGINYFGGSNLNVQNWARENAVVIGMLLPVIAALLWKARWVQVVTASAILVLCAIYLIAYYPALR